MKKGLLLINLGTPDSPSVKDVRRYLAEFLSDWRVIDLPAPLRYLLLYAFILPFRPKQSAHAYQTIWTDQGSPLLVYSQELLKKIQIQLNESYQVSLGMRYGTPSIEHALKELKDCQEITVLPLYPQYASASTGSSIEYILNQFSKSAYLPNLRIIRDFHDHPAFIDTFSNQIKPHLQKHDHILFSYHGLPERQLTKLGCKPVCAENCPIETAPHNACYRAQCARTTALIAKQLALESSSYSMSFQSRLGKTPWIQPYTDEILIELIGRGVKNLAVTCPSFVTDCLETLEEIAIRAREQWLSLGGENLTLIPSLNDSSEWVSAILEIAGCNTQ